MDKPTTAPVISNVTPRSREILATLSANTYREAYGRGMSLSAYLEEVDPSEQYKDGLDAFERLLKEAGIRTRGNRNLGVRASTFEEFLKDEHTRALVPEWATRVMRAAAGGQSQADRVGTRAVPVFNSGDNVEGSVMNRIYYDATARMQQIAPAIPLAELISVETGIDSATYESFYLTEPAAADKRMSRVSEGADISIVKLAGGDHTIRLHKYARGLEATYEILRRQPIDLLAIHLSRIAIQNETDKVANAIAVLVNGDGNSNTSATNSNLTALDSGTTANNLTIKGWLAFKLLFLNPYAVTTAIVQSGGALSLQLLNMGSANVPLVTVQAALGFGGFVPINRELADVVRLGITSDAPANVVVAFDNRFALQRVYEIGADITEVERYVQRQTQALFISEVEGYAVIDPKAVRTLTLSA